MNPGENLKLKLDLDETLIWGTLAVKRTVLFQSWPQSSLGVSFSLVLLLLVLEVVPLVWEVFLGERLLILRVGLVVVGLVGGGDSRSDAGRQDLGVRLPLKLN